MVDTTRLDRGCWRWQPSRQKGEEQAGGLVAGRCCLGKRTQPLLLLVRGNKAAAAACEEKQGRLLLVGEERRRDWLGKRGSSAEEKGEGRRRRVTAWSCERLGFHGFLYCFYFILFYLLLLGLFYLFLSRFIFLRDPTKRLTFVGSHILIK